MVVSFTHFSSPRHSWAIEIRTYDLCKIKRKRKYEYMAIPTFILQNVVILVPVVMESGKPRYLI
jgi:hypothetical protein